MVTLQIEKSKYVDAQQLLSEVAEDFVDAVVDNLARALNAEEGKSIMIGKPFFVERFRAELKAVVRRSIKGSRG